MKFTTKFKLALASSLIVVILTPPGAARAGAGVRGGEVVYLNGKYVNRDFLDGRKNCWISGLQVEDSYPATKKIIKALARIDWYFAMTLEKRLHSLRFCFGGTLKPIEIDTRQTITADKHQYVSFFVALQNEEGQVLEDAALLRKIEDENNELTKEEAQGMHFLHEASHAFLPSATPDDDRRQAIFDLVATYKEIYLGRMRSREDLYRVLAESHFDFPLTGSYLDPYRKQIEFLLGDNTQRDQIFFSTPNLDKALTKDLRKISDHVGLWEDKNALQNPLRTFRSYLEGLFLKGTEEQINFALNEQKYKVIDPAPVALGVYPNLSEGQQKKLRSHMNVKALIRKSIESLSEAGVVVHDGLLYPNAELRSLSDSNSDKRTEAVMRLKPLSGRGSIPFEIRIIAVSLSLMVDQGDWNGIAAVVAENPGFYDVLNLANTSASISRATYLVARERGYVLEALEGLRSGLATTFYQYLRGMLDADDFTRLASLIHWERLGNLTVQ